MSLAKHLADQSLFAPVVSEHSAMAERSGALEVGPKGAAQGEKMGERRRVRKWGFEYG